MALYQKDVKTINQALNTLWKSFEGVEDLLNYMLLFREKLTKALNSSRHDMTSAQWKRAMRAMDDYELALTNFDVAADELANALDDLEKTRDIK